VKHETELERSGEQGTRSGGVAEYRRRPVLLQELKGKEEEEEDDDDDDDDDDDEDEDEDEEEEEEEEEEKESHT